VRDGARQASGAGRLKVKGVLPSAASADLVMLKGVLPFAASRAKIRIT